jgi:hypothetical protein
MSNTKIVIDKEQKNGIVNKMLQKIIDTLPVKPVFEGDVLIALHDELLDVLTQNSTEIQIDQSIEERAEKDLLAKLKIATSYKYQEYAGDNYSTLEHDADTLKECVQIAKDFATSQQIIEQLRVKEKIVLDSNLKIKEKTTVLMEGTYYPNDGFWINGIKVFPDYYTIR